jgi:hypothetical protein
MKTKRLYKGTNEGEIFSRRFMGRNSFGDHSNLSITECREIVNFDIYESENKEDDFLKSRSGSQYIIKTGSVARGPTDVQNGLIWDVGSYDHLITQEGNKFYSQNVTLKTNPVEILTASDTSFTIGETDPCDMMISGDRVYIFSPTGNKVIEYDSTSDSFFGRSMGLTAPKIIAITSATAGVITGTYTVGVELCYFTADGEKLASSPNRLTTGRILAQTGLISSKKIKVTISPTELLDTTWTHLRLWRSKNESLDLSDPLNPIDAQGIPNELYEEALITRAEMESGSLASIATGATLPIGNAGCQAGKPSGVYTIEVNNLDSVLFDMVDIERIELEPITACGIGCYHDKKIFISQINDPALDENSKNALFYANFADTKYCEQYNPLNFVSTNRDGQRMIKLISMGNDLVGIKESKTGILAGGNVNQQFQIVDHHVGISDKKRANFIPGVGICALTNDNNDFRIFTSEWQSRLHGIDLGEPIRNETKDFGNYVSFIYINGKLIICDGVQTCYVLHEKSKRGWTKYEFATNIQQIVLTYNNGKKALICSKEEFLIDIEVEGLETDCSVFGDTPIATEIITARFKHNEGQSIIEHNVLDLSANLTFPMYARPSVNGTPWPLRVSDTTTMFEPNPSVYGGLSGSRDGVYKLYLTPATIGDYKFCRPVGNYIHYQLTGQAPITIKRISLRCIIDEDGVSFGTFDPFNIGVAQDEDPLFYLDTLDSGTDLIDTLASGDSLLDIIWRT